MLNSKLYDRLKFFAQTGLPAIIAAYASFSDVWDLPNTIKVVATLGILNTLLGVLVGVNSSMYKNNPARFDGTMNVSDAETRQVHTLRFTTDPEEMAEKSELVIKVEKDSDDSQGKHSL